MIATLRERTHLLKDGPEGKGPVLYWMHREHRAQDNWGLLAAAQEAERLQRPFAVVYCLAGGFLGATIRQFGFLLRAMELVRRELETAGIPFVFLRGEPGREVAAYAAQIDAALLVTDFDPLRIKQQWMGQVLASASFPVLEVDSRNVVPARVVSDKKEYMARTIRPRIHRQLPVYLTDFPALPGQKRKWQLPVPGEGRSLTAALDTLAVDRDVPEVDWCEPGTAAGLVVLHAFIATRLGLYTQRNDPNAKALSDLSPYLHFGCISAQRVAWEVSRAQSGEAVEVFLEELVVRRELADNFCLFEPGYDSFEGFPQWARTTLDEHRLDEREHVYSMDSFEQARTHDPLWNAAQLQMVRSGKMHGWLRMYWGKKILEWSPTPEEAMQTAIYLNDRYSLDGRDTNGYTGIAWCIGGVHDRAWKERPIFGKVRYMNYNGALRKFDVDRFVDSIQGARQGEQFKLC